MLTLIGLGLFDEKDITINGLEAARSADKVYLESYTGKWFGNIDALRDMVGKQIEKLTRNDLEGNSGVILKEAKTKSIVIFVQGDPLIATTHSALLMDAKRQKIETKVIHNSSIVSAIGETGLHIYKFGPTVTIPFAEKTQGKLPKSVFEVINENKKRGLHTLCLLDVIADESGYMSVKQALDILSNDESITKEKLVVFVQAGGNKPLITYGTFGNLMKSSLDETPAVIIVPGKLHFTEKEYLDLYEV